MTIGEFHRAMVARLTRAGIDTPGLDVRLLIQSVMEWTHADYIVGKQEVVSAVKLRVIQGLVERRLRGEPLDHIFGYREFYGRKFEVTKDVLSPRPETEGLVDKAIEVLRDMSAPNVLDLGTGTGAIIISILAELPSSQGVGVDISHAALNIARKNSKIHDVEARLGLIQGNWFEPVAGTYDLIVSNPPYITHAAMETLPVEVRAFDPDVALRGGQDGLAAYKVILSSAELFLNDGGHVLFEIGYDQSDAVSDLMKEAGYRDVEVLKDLAGNDRIVVGIRRDN